MLDLFRERLPEARLGVSHCARFYTPRDGGRGLRDLTRGMRSLDQIRSSGREVDFFAVHGHRPFDLWADPRAMYRTMDAFAEKGVRIHITETGIPHAGNIKGDVRKGTWTEELQADYLERFLKVCYSHPTVDVVNFWGFGPRTWQPRIGLLDENFEPRPAFHVLRRLVRETWWTDREGRAGREGDFAFRGHRGSYRVRVTYPDGREAVCAFRLEAESGGELEVVVE